MKINKKLIVTCSLVAIWLLLVVIVLVFTVRTKNKTVDVTENTNLLVNTPIVEEVTSGEEVVYSTMTDVAFTYENTVSALQSTDLKQRDIEVIAYMLTSFSADVTSWSLKFNQGYCDTILLYLNDIEDEAYMTIMCMSDDTTVGRTDNQYVFCKDGVTLTYDELTVTSAVDLLNKANVDWTWNTFEVTYLLGVLDTEYPNMLKSILNDTLIVDNKVIGSVGKASFTLNETVYSVYDRVLSDDEPIISEDLGWYVPDVLTVSTVEEWLTSERLDIPYELEAALNKMSNVHDYWYIEYTDNILLFNSVKVDSKYQPNGFIIYKLASYDYVENTWRF